MTRNEACRALQDAATALAGAQPVQTRLEHAIHCLSALSAEARDELPPLLAGRLVKIVGTVATRHANGGTVAAVCRAMSDDEAVEIARMIVSLFDEVSQWHAIRYVNGMQHR